MSMVSRTGGDMVGLLWLTMFASDDDDIEMIFGAIELS